MNLKLPLDRRFAELTVSTLRSTERWDQSFVASLRWLPKPPAQSAVMDSGPSPFYVLRCRGATSACGRCTEKSNPDLRLRLVGRCCRDCKLLDTLSMVRVRSMVCSTGFFVHILARDAFLSIGSLFSFQVSTRIATLFLAGFFSSNL